ncbi:Uma2 family endonuclease [Desulfofundulus sp. TPOSR]|uniref:Uma2 family endonuclease n=1 Tax=Desulfofundulus sp. TPOSR TaxID=2714340 RepID=UPI001407E3A0|nr:Uma2 family endonuclease [Desulfofundulus sp. TPOSR]NHM28173.1 Uma2 family endonuclease [Desulfofundulus sp. TPOSR]
MLYQKVVGRFYARLERLLSGTPCEPFVVPTDVVFSEYDVVQPDVFVVCDQGIEVPLREIFETVKPMEKR